MGYQLLASGICVEQDMHYITGVGLQHENRSASMLTPSDLQVKSITTTETKLALTNIQIPESRQFSVEKDSLRNASPVCMYMWCYDLQETGFKVA